MKDNMHKQRKSSFLDGGNADYLEELYEAYLSNPTEIDPHWRTCFETLPIVDGTTTDTSHADIKKYFLDLAQQKQYRLAQTDSVTQQDIKKEKKQVRVLQLINAFRFRGHQLANLDPLGLTKQRDIPELTLEHHELSETDYPYQFNTGSLVGPENLSLQEIHKTLLKTYCGSVGAEYMHITDTSEKRWIQNRLEGSQSTPALDASIQKRILSKLTAAEGLEKYLHSRYVGQKRFSLEGSESLIPLLDELIQRSGQAGICEIVVGMAHRGRLNVLVNTLGKAPGVLFDEFEGKNTHSSQGSGDVKYHLGFSSDINTGEKDVHVALAFNPSHLEIVSPVVAGSVRARQQRRNDREKNQVMPVLIHGDAAFAGQGVVMETFNMSQARGYSVGGTVHIVVNNQIGFTTSNPLDSRSTLYCTDVAKMVQAPIFHVNADDPEAVIFVTQIALDYRMQFNKDVVIDLVCYRRHGHNEADEPMATQPLMYQTIKKHPTTLKLYSEHLQQQSVVDSNASKELVAAYRKSLEAGQKVVEELAEETTHPFAQDWERYIGHHWSEIINGTDTSIPLKTFRELAHKLEQLPEGLDLNPRVRKIIDDRKKMTAGALPIDWGYAENMAYASLLNQDFGVRISGQDSGRGTFFHRHAALHNQSNGHSYLPLQHLSDTQPQFLVIDSLLSEEAVLGYEYGYSTTDPKTLVIWEAQFGDFANGAQVVIDQFISSGEQKWGRHSALVMLLPHGYEGQGPEHSSARLERYLQLCAQHNIQVCVPTTPAQVFHMLRRQIITDLRKPLIVMTPKSLLRHRLAVSSLEEVCDGSFQVVIPEIDDHNKAKVDRIVLCSGKVYYDLLEKRRELGLENVILARIEQLYPFPETSLKALLADYKNAKTVVWCQEEPKNQGAWYCSKHHLENCLKKGQTLSYAGREASAAPAIGYYSIHVEQQKALVDEALGISSVKTDD